MTSPESLLTGDPPTTVRTRREPGAPTVARVVAAVLGIVVAGLAFAVQLAGHPTYRSTATLLIDQPRAIAAGGDAGVISKLGALRYKYADLVATDVIAGPVAHQLGMPVGTVRQALTADAPMNSLLVTVQATASDAARAHRLAAAAAGDVVHYAANEQVKNRIPTDQRFTFSVVVPADAGQPVTSKLTSKAAIAVIAGALAAAAGYAATVLLRRR